MVKSVGEGASKTCSKCGETKSCERFAIARGKKRRAACKDCINAQVRAARKKCASRHRSGLRSRATQQKCGACGKTLPASSFFKNSYKPSGLAGECKACKLAYDQTYYEKPRPRAQRLVTMARHRANKLGVPFDITPEDILPALELGLCELSNLPFDMTYKRNKDIRQGNPYSPSIDRITPALGYTRDNVRVVLYSINLALSNWGASVFEEIAYRHLLHARPDLVVPRQRRHRADNDNQLCLFPNEEDFAA